ncbi:Hypothetical predicted protein [Cloeon dipterum]|uniref:ADP-ribosylation factor-like protein 6 n=1 Tax=Cloeon dipterum TaxID=197152 RepID=A0A8S1CI14_9INSE|nr:Hypothetical predicted protein [Cloeon dipterum]
MKPQDEEAGGPLLNSLLGAAKIKPAAANSFLGSPATALPRHNTFTSNASSMQALSAKQAALGARPAGSSLSSKLAALQGGIKRSHNHCIDEADLADKEEATSAPQPRCAPQSPDDAAMGPVSSVVLNPFSPRKFNVVMVGCFSTGKTTILYQLKEGREVITISTVGCNLEEIPFRDVVLAIWDMKGLDTTWRNWWRIFYKEKHGVIFVLDSASDAEQAEEEKQQLRLVAEDEYLAGLPFLVLANKQDAPGARSPAQLVQDLQMRQALAGRPWHIQATCGAQGQGLRQGLAWLVNEMEKKWDSPVQIS